MATKKEKQEKAAATQAASEAAGPGPSVEGRAEANAEAQKAEAEAQEQSQSESQEQDANKEASEDAGGPGEGASVIEDAGTITDARTQKRYEVAEEERLASVHDEAQDPKENDPDAVLEVSDSYRDEVAKRYEWQARVTAEKERFLRVYQQGSNPLDSESPDEEAAEEVRKDPAFAALASSDDRLGVQNLSEGKTYEEAAAIRKEQGRQAATNSQDDTLQRQNVGQAEDSPHLAQALEAREEQEGGSTPEDPQELNADELIDKIKEADSVEQVEELAGDDDRKTVKQAADKRKDEL
jgi:hypothetical protein